MFIVDISSLMTLILILAFTVLIIYLGRETKKSFIPAIALAIYLVLLLVYVVQFIDIGGEPNSQPIIAMISRCMGIDFLLILATYLGYLWVDDIETKVGKKKGIASSDLDWLWKKV